MTSNHSAPLDGEIVTGRIFPVPAERLFAAFSDPVRLAAWWGPTGFTNTFREFEFRSGGAWKFTMHGPDGARYEMDHQFIEIVPPRLIVVRHLQPGHDFTLIVTLVGRDDRTEVVWRMRFDDPAEALRVRPFIIPANEQNLDRLAAHLSLPGSGFQLPTNHPPDAEGRR